MDAKEEGGWEKGAACGIALYKAGDYGGAVVEFGLALAAAGEGAAPSAATLSALYSNRAAALVMLKRFEEAREECDRGLVQDPGNAKLLIRKSKCALACDDAEGALAALGAVLEADPTNAAALNLIHTTRLRHSVPRAMAAYAAVPQAEAGPR